MAAFGRKTSQYLQRFQIISDPNHQADHLSHRLTRKQAGLLAERIPKLLRQAIRWCGTSFSDYRDADDKRGAFQDHLRVYDRQGEACQVCSSTIKRVALGNRSAFYCPSCQK